MTSLPHTQLNSWDPAIPGQKVRLKDNPGKTGHTTGKTKSPGSQTLVQIDFGPNDKQYKNYLLLELVNSDDDLFATLASGRFGDASDLRRLLAFEKIKGELTNVFYSMEASNTDFFPHQFKAVLRFIESPVGRLLIADEVGLGKTIESIYIWKELQAREDARRLLVVCPAMLREKWQRDLQERFNISSEIVDGKALLNALKPSASARAFCYIASFESMRPPPDYSDSTIASTRTKLARLFEENKAIDQSALFDLVIIDEAHYMRNTGTATNRLGKLLREAAHFLVLLTATPVQISTDNLFQVLRLIDPDEFYDSFLFEQRISANAPIVAALDCLRKKPPDLQRAAGLIQEAKSNSFFRDDNVLEWIHQQLNATHVSSQRRIELSRMLENRSLLSQYMVRSRKREVLADKAERSPQTLSVQFSEIERDIYKQVTRFLWSNLPRDCEAPQFAIIMRQRQMASSLVAALEAWRCNDDFEDLFWEDLGPSEELESAGIAETRISDELVNTLDIRKLESADSKYQKLKDLLFKELSRNRSEKFVVFAFFRRTLEYLQRRLRDDGISAVLILGGMGDESFKRIEQFKNKSGPCVLLSSEVGSEGIDLQFCRVMVNYDLPWNPMRVEQRIGRLDRLGQKAEQISIINVVVENTIEDRILMRLYERIDLFKESIGDLESILGVQTYKLIEQLLDPNLDEETRNRRAKEAEDALINQRDHQKILEEQAVNLVGFSDYIHEQINSSRKMGRWLSADELLSLVDDFFARNYPGSIIELAAESGHVASMNLSADAKVDLSLFISKQKPATRTRLHLAPTPILCYFDSKQSRKFGQREELIDPTHPLIQWIRKYYEDQGNSLHQVSAVLLDAKHSPVAAGSYAYAVQRWSFDGLRKEHLLTFMAIELNCDEPLGEQRSEELVTLASRHGKAFPNAAQLIGDLDQLTRKVEFCDANLDTLFGVKSNDFETQNTLRCRQQEISADNYRNRLVDELHERIERYRREGKASIIPATQGLVKKAEFEFNLKRKRIAEKRSVDPTLTQLAVGFIRVI